MNQCVAALIDDDRATVFDVIQLVAAKVRHDRLAARDDQFHAADIVAHVADRVGGADGNVINALG